ncbi:MAG TPA: cation:proton antiporter [Polyangiaceae bacterium]|nr:cation:proton antiporter [Polyangiaceae bacterium]
MSVFLVLVLTGLMRALASFDADEKTSAGVSLALGYLLLCAYFIGGLFKRVGLPKLTGYIATGVLVGPSLLGLVTGSMLESTRIVNGVAVALIALTAGSELEYRAMRPLFRSIREISAYGVLGTAFLLACAVYLARGLLPFMQALSQVEAMAMSMVLGVVMVAQSPAVVVALRDEMEAEGPLASTVLGVVVIADLVVILLFALSSSLAKAVLGGGLDMLQTGRTLAWELLGSLVAGAVIGYLLGLYLRKVAGGAALFVLLIAFIIAEVGQRLHFDPLLVALAAGMFVRNLTQVGDELHRHIQAPALPVYILFFAGAGANLHLDVLWVVGLPAVLFVLVRAGGLLAGAAIGARIAEAPPVVRRYAGFGLLPQAGLALALSLLFAKTFPEFGAEAGALTLGVVAINEMVAPAVYRLALVRSGEAYRKRAEPSPAAPTTPLPATPLPATHPSARAPEA